MKKSFLACFVVQSIFLQAAFCSSNSLLFLEKESSETTPNRATNSDRVSSAVPDTLVKIDAPKEAQELYTTLSSTEFIPEKNVQNCYGELLFFMSLLYKSALPGTFLENHRLTIINKIGRDHVEQSFSQVLKNLFPTLTLDHIIKAVEKELYQQIQLAKHSHNWTLQERLTRALSALLSYQSRTYTPFLLSFIREATLSSQIKADVLKTISNLFIDSTILKQFVRMLNKEDLSLKSLDMMLQGCDYHTLHNLLFLLEMFCEPKTIQNLREQEVSSRQENGIRLDQIAQLEDPRVKKVRTVLIHRLANILQPQAGNRDFNHFTSYSSLPTNTIAEVLHLVIERYPALLHEFVSITWINAYRNWQEKPQIIAFSKYNTANKFMTMLTSREKPCNHLNTMKLYNAIKISLNTFYKEAL